MRRVRWLTPARLPGLRQRFLSRGRALLGGTCPGRCVCHSPRFWWKMTSTGDFLLLVLFFADRDTNVVFMAVMSCVLETVHVCHCRPPAPQYLAVLFARLRRDTVMSFWWLQPRWPRQSHPLRGFAPPTSFWHRNDDSRGGSRCARTAVF